MPKNLTPEDRWETHFEVPIPGEPRNIGPLEVLFQRILNRTERLKSRIAAILGLPWDATPPDTLAGLAGRVSALEGGSAALSTHREAPVLDHPDGSVTQAKLANSAVTNEKIADGAVTASKLAPWAAVANLGYVPVNKAGDTMGGSLTVPSLLVEGGGNAITFKEGFWDNTPAYLQKRSGLFYLSFATDEPIRVYRGVAAGWPADFEIFKDTGNGELPVYLRFHQKQRHWSSIKATSDLISFVSGNDAYYIGIRARSLSGSKVVSRILWVKHGGRNGRRGAQEVDQGGDGPAHPGRGQGRH